MIGILPRKGGSILHQLPRLHCYTKDSAKHLATANSKPPWEEASHITSKWNRVCSKVGHQNTQVDCQSSKEDARARTSAEVMIEDSLEEVLYVPLGNDIRCLHGSRGGHEDANVLGNTGISRLLAVSSKIRLVDQHRRERTEDGIDAGHDAPS